MDDLEFCQPEADDLWQCEADGCEHHWRYRSADHTKWLCPCCKVFETQAENVASGLQAALL